MNQKVRFEFIDCLHFRVGNIDQICSKFSGQILECSLAKPQADQKSGVINTQTQGLLQSYQPRGGYGLVAGGYGALGAGYGAPSLAQVLCAFLF